MRIARIGRVVYGAQNDRFGGCGSVLNVHTRKDMPVLGIENFECIGPTDNQRSIVMLKELFAYHNDNLYSLKNPSEKIMNIEKQFYEQQNPNAPEGKTKKRKVKNLNSENKRQKI